MLELEKLTGNGVSLNTSLNRRGEPMICSPTDALNMFYGSDLQYLIMEDILVVRTARIGMTASEQWVLQFCHSYDGPFRLCAAIRRAFVGTPYKVCTVYLTGAPDEEVVQGSASDEVIFLDYRSRDVRGLKLRAVRDIRKIAATRNFPSASLIASNQYM